MSWKRYRRTSIAEMRRYRPGESLEGVSIGDNCRAQGGPKDGDYIARDPHNHSDKWVVLKGYADKNFEQVPPGVFMSVAWR